MHKTYDGLVIKCATIDCYKFILFSPKCCFSPSVAVSSSHLLNMYYEWMCLPMYMFQNVVSNRWPYIQHRQKCVLLYMFSVKRLMTCHRLKMGS